MSLSNIQSIKLCPERREEIFKLLAQLTSAFTLDQTRFENIIYNLNDNHNIYVYIKDDKVVGIITLFMEQKLIHNGACVAHIEDLVVDKDYQKQNIATELINYCLSKVNTYTHYKVILNCTQELESFYNKFKFVKKNIQMAYYL